MVSKEDPECTLYKWSMGHFEFTPIFGSYTESASNNPPLPSLSNMNSGETRMNGSFSSINPHSSRYFHFQNQHGTTSQIVTGKEEVLGRTNPDQAFQKLGSSHVNNTNTLGDQFIVNSQFPTARVDYGTVGEISVVSPIQNGLTVRNGNDSNLCPYHSCFACFAQRTQLERQNEIGMEEASIPTYFTQQFSRLGFNDDLPFNLVGSSSLSPYKDEHINLYNRSGSEIDWGMPRSTQTPDKSFFLTSTSNSLENSRHFSSRDIERGNTGILTSTSNSLENSFSSRDIERGNTGKQTSQDPTANSSRDIERGNTGKQTSPDPTVNQHSLECILMFKDGAAMLDFACKNNGSLLLQSFLTGEGANRVDDILKLLLSSIIELMCSEYGNYAFQRLFEVCNNDQKRKITLAMLNKGNLTSIAADSYGTRSLQKLIVNLKDSKLIGKVMSALSPGLIDLMDNKTGKHIVNLCIECLNREQNLYIYKFLVENCIDFSCHQQRYRVLTKWIDRYRGDSGDQLLMKIAENCLLLSKQEFGNFVVQAVLLNIPNFRVTIINKLKGNFLQLSMGKHSSYVVQWCIETTRSACIIQELLAYQDRSQLFHHQRANYVIATALDHYEGEVLDELVSAIDKENLIFCPSTSGILKKLACIKNARKIQRHEIFGSRTLSCAFQYNWNKQRIFCS
ncbi:hypothetical protein AMTRI_Chr10g230350 [Amborella trichopoda]|uniref:pumilio domain-containing protein C4G8.03c-like n=1 Tax=Amborella trichopoda TaxID=13333 RepID=UPI0009BDF427|nr:pumilio domain-containing protein C4G8.03c-like [Amborella trichopoda]|eukprot:XP_020518918.1 pumilio domain-containing protein C4G8.03c-like [Amborella trichopoda]